MSERNQNKWSQLLQKAFAYQGQELRKQHPEWEPTPECPPLSLFQSGHRRGDWEQRYKDHFATGCPYCQKNLMIAACVQTEETPVETIGEGNGGRK